MDGWINGFMRGVRAQTTRLQGGDAEGGLGRGDIQLAPERDGA
jgi:hypothetical protein